ncbi:MAG: thrombospondin type 3 repeat-containing protein [Bacteriovorax sp.]|jgi:hypothetical protein
MNLNLLIISATLLAFCSCGFKSDDPQNSNLLQTSKELKIDPNGDTDGDGIKDGDEVARGSNPFVADIPDLKVRFLQNYKIEVFYHDKDKDPVKDQKTFTVNTDIKDTNPDFKFRVGNVFARNHALKTAASFGRFSSHTSGNFVEHDLSWISYPELDPKFFHNEALKYRDILNDKNIIDNIKITLTNQVRLNESPFFKEVKNLRLNFYFLNHETENYDVLSSVNVDRHFQSGIYESFDVVIDHAPLSLLKESFLKRGEFIISEIEDYEIPTLTTNFKTLLASIKEKTIPVLYETPLEEKTYYVASGIDGVRFQEILKIVFDKNYEVKADALLKIGQFQNNLTDFTYLKEIQDKDKLGKWFVMTNEFKENYLDHLYNSNDRIILSYITGTDLASQKQEDIYSYTNYLTSNKSESVLPLGNVSANSSISVQLKPIHRFGLKVENEKIHFVTPNSCGKNCFPKPMVCDWDVNKFSNYNEEFSFASDLLGEGEKLSLIINGDEFKISNLIKEKKLVLYTIDQNVHLIIKDINKIKELKPFEESNLSLKIKAFIGNDFFGVKLVGASGDWQGFGGCPFNTPGVAETRKTTVSNDSREIAEIKGWASTATSRGWPYPLTYSDSGPYYQEISLGVSSNIQNYFN